MRVSMDTFRMVNFLGGISRVGDDHIGSVGYGFNCFLFSFVPTPSTFGLESLTMMQVRR